MMYKKEALNGVRDEVAEDAVEMEAEAPMADAGAAAQAPVNDDFQYRPAEMPLAFFEPSLTTGWNSRSPRPMPIPPGIYALWRSPPIC